ncbi:MAG: hypothetical protein IJU75_03805 [Clostridia bacterium]|nr:hypothetical protein [Clostridia bacterium]
MKKLTGLILAAALVLSLTAVFAYAEDDAGGESEITISANIPSATDVNGIGAYYVHNCVVTTISGNMALAPADGQTTSQYNLDPNGPAEYDGKAIKLGAMPENISEQNALYNPYVAYKVGGEKGKVIDTLSIDMRYYLRQHNHAYYQIGIWVTDKFEHDENGAYDFTAQPYAKLLTSDETNAADHRRAEDTEHIDLTDDVRKLNSEDIYVIFLMIRGADNSAAGGRIRIQDFTITATRKAKQSGGSSGGAVIKQGEDVVINANIPSSSRINDIGAFYNHNCVVTTISGNMALAPADGQTTSQYNLDPNGPEEVPDAGGTLRKIKLGAQPENTEGNDKVFNPYVAYKIAGDRGNVIDTLELDIRYYLAGHNQAYYQIGIWVTDKFEHDANGAFDFTARPYAKLLTSGEGEANDHRGEAEVIDLSSAVKKLNSRDVYVIILLIRGADNSAAGGRIRIQDMALKATQKIASAATSDPTVSAAVAGAVFCALVLPAVTKIRRKAD